MRMRERGIEFESLAGGAVGLGKIFTLITAVVGQHGVGVGEAGVGERVTRILGNGFIEVGDRRLKLAISAVIPGIAAF